MSTESETGSGPSAAPTTPDDTPPDGTPPDELGQTLKVASDHRRAARLGSAGRLGLRVGLLAVILGLWWLVTALGWVKPLYLPSPGSVWSAFVRANSCYPATEGSSRLLCGEQNYYLWEHLIASLQRMVVGVGAAVVLGPVVGFLMARVRWLNTAVEPALNFVRSLPPLAYLPLLIVWFGINDVSKNWLLFLAAFPPIVIATINGVNGIREDRVHAALSMGANRRQVATQVVLPSALPDVLGGIRIAVGFAWTTVVAAELINGIPGIGGLAFVSGTQLKTPLVFACIIVIGLTALALDALIKYLGTVLVPWYGKA